QFQTPIADGLTKLLADNPDDEEVLQALVEGYIQVRNWTQAEEYLSRLIERQPDNVQAWLKRGQVRRAALENDQSQNHDKAAADFQEVLRRVPDYFEARM